MESDRFLCLLRIHPAEMFIVVVHWPVNKVRMDQPSKTDGGSEVIGMDYDSVSQNNDIDYESGERFRFLQLKIEDDNISVCSRRSEHPPDLHIREDDEHHTHTVVPKTKLQ